MLKELEPMVSQFARSRATLYDAIDGLAPEQLDVCLPDRTWSIQDTMAHIASNEVLMTRLLESIALGTATTLPADFDNEKFNQQEVEKARGKTVQELRKHLDESFEQLIAFLGTVTPDQLDRRGVHPAAGDASFKEFLLAMYAHEEVHCRDIIQQARALKRQAAS